MKIITHKRNLFRIGAAVVVAGALSATGMGVSAAQGNEALTPSITRTPAASTHYKLYMLPKYVGILVFTANQEGGQLAASHLGDKLTFDGPSTGEASLEAPLLTDVAAEGYQGLAFDADDPSALVPELQNVARAGVKIITFDSDVTNPALRSIFVSAPSDLKVATLMIQAIVKQVGDTGQIAIIGSTTEDPTSAAWNVGIEAVLREPMYSGLKLVKIEYGDGVDATVTSDTEGLLLAYPHLKAIISTNGGDTNVVASTIQKEGKCGQVAVTGTGDPLAEKAALDNGCMYGFPSWNELDYGCMAVYTLHDLVAGVISGKTGQTYDIPICGGLNAESPLGKITIGANGVAYFPLLTLITKANVGEYKF
jgi:rhamnose transport system substrate-binding protein